MRLLSVELIAGLLASLAASCISASDAYVVRYFTGAIPFSSDPCQALTYRDDLIFHNSSGQDASVGLLGVSNGTQPSPRGLTIPAGAVVSSEGGGSSAAATWAPDPQPALWVAHLDLPEGVDVSSRLIVIVGNCPSGMPDSASHVYAGIKMPVVHALVPAGQEQVLLGADIGGTSVGSSDGRTNIGVYNGGSTSGIATAELHRACDGSLLESRSVTIAPNTITQLNGFSEVFEGCSGLRAAFYETYVSIRVDQPSFGYAVTLSNERPPLIPVSSAP